LGLPNLTFLIIGFFTYLPRAVFVVDYALAALVSLFLSRLGTIGLFIAIFAIDLGFAIAPAYHMQGEDFAMNAYAVFLMSWPTILITCFLILTPIIIAARIFQKYLAGTSSLSYRDLFVILGAAVCLLIADIINGSNVFIQTGRNVISYNIAGSNLIKVFTGVNRDSRQENPPQALARGSSLTATDKLRALLDDKRPLSRNILLVVVESWGQPISTTLQDNLTKPFFSEAIRSRYLIRQGEIPFSGSTVSGELRELCWQRISSPNQVESVSMQACLPNQLRAKGYSTTALHGFSRFMFRRNDWYATLGFDNHLFADDLQAMGYTSRCGHVFRGACDSDIADYIKKSLKNSSGVAHGSHGNPRFIYWLTLNTHLPIARDTSIEQKLDCSMINPVSDHEDRDEKCRLNGLLLGTFKLIADIAENEDDLRLIIVGDHSPPFVFLKDREWVKNGVVPFVELIPKRPAKTDG